MATHDPGELGAVYRAATAPCPVALDGCPTADELVALAEGRLDGPRRDAVLALVASCASCADAVRFARASGAELAGADPESPRRTQPKPAQRWAPAALLTALAVAVLVAWLPLSDENDAVLRGGAGAVEPADGATLSVAPPALAWSGDGACAVTLRDAGAARLWQSAPSSTGTIAVPDEVRAKLAAGSYLWRLECGGVVRGTYRFTVR